MTSILTNPIVSPEQLANSPSREDGFSAEEERSLMFAGVRLVHLCGVQLNLPQNSILTAQIILQRFYILASFGEHPLELTVPAVLLIVSKLESRPFPASLLLATITTLLYCPHPLPARAPIKPIPAPPIPATLYTTELTILRVLGFDGASIVQLPHVLALQYLQVLELLTNTDVCIRTLGYLNDAIYSPSLLYATHLPHILATAAIYLASRECGVNLPKGMEVQDEEWGWWDIFDVDREELGFVVVGMKGLEEVVETEMKRTDQVGSWKWVADLFEEKEKEKEARSYEKDEGKAA